MTVSIPKDLRKALLSESGPMAIPSTANNLTSILLKLDDQDIADANKNNVKVLFRPECRLYDTGAIFRLLTQFGFPTQDSEIASERFVFDCFLYVHSPTEFALLRALSNQMVMHYHIFDQALTYKFTKQIGLNAQFNADMRQMLTQALKHDQTVKLFDRAASKASALAETDI